MRVPAKLLLSSCLALLVLGVAVPDAHAQYIKSFLIKRPGLYVGKLGPGAARTCKGNLLPAVPNKAWNPQIDAITSVTLTRSATNACGTATVSTVGDSFFVNWGGECAAVGDFVILTFKSTTPITSGGAVWQDNFGNTVDPGAFTTLAFPALDARGIALLTASLGVLGLWVIRRRRPVTDAI